jgi:hypothetical protein
MVNQWDGASASPVNPPHSITLTTTTTGQSRSAFFTTRQQISDFQVDFTYTFTGSASSKMGAAFVLQNVSAGAGAVAVGSASGVATNVGYSDLFGTFGGQSVAISLETSYLAPGSSSTGVFTGGSFGGGSPTTGSVVFSSGNPIDVSIGYNGSLLAMSAHDTVTGAIYNAPLVPLNLEGILGDGFAYVGFTGSTNGNADTTQTFSNFRFTSIPAPSSLCLLAAGTVCGARRRRA